MQRITDYRAAQAKGQGQHESQAAGQPTTEHDRQASPPAADPLPLAASRSSSQTAFSRPLVPHIRRGNFVRNCRAKAPALSIKLIGRKNPAHPRVVAANGGQSGCKTVGERAQARADQPAYHADPAARACASRPRSCAHGRAATVHGSSGLRTTSPPRTAAGVWTKFRRQLLCELFGHHYGDAADAGLVPGVVCYRCGHRLHRCNGRLR